MKGYKIFPVLLLAGVIGSTLPGCASQPNYQEQTAAEIQAAEAARQARIQMEEADAARMRAEQEAERAKRTLRKSLVK